MIIYLEGNLFESPIEVFVNPVNTVGVMGKGLALQFKLRYPEMFLRYQELCRQGLLDIGKLWLYKTSEGKHLLCFPTKKDWRDPSRLEYIEAGLQKFASTYSHHSISSIAFPPLGCGNSGLDWNRVRLLMERYLSNLPIQVYIYVPSKPKPKRI